MEPGNGSGAPSLREPTGRRGQTGAGASVSGRERCSRETRGAGVGKTNVGKGSKVMAVVDGAEAPIGVPVDRAQSHDITLAEPMTRLPSRAAAGVPGRDHSIPCIQATVWRSRK